MTGCTWMGRWVACFANASTYVMLWPLSQEWGAVLTAPDVPLINKRLLEVAVGVLVERQP